MTDGMGGKSGCLGLGELKRSGKGGLSESAGREGGGGFVGEEGMGKLGKGSGGRGAGNVSGMSPGV